MTDTHGRFIWYELMTPDSSSAKRFYSDVVGWNCDDSTPGYTIVGPGVGVGGIMETPAEAQARGVPPNWIGYVAVDDVDASATKTKQLGGSVHVEPTDIPNIGRFAVVADPGGALIAMMTPVPPAQPRPETPQGTPGHGSWHELYAGDLEKASAFYGDLFGWRTDSDMDMGGGMGVYRLFANQVGRIGGMMGKPPQIPTPAWLYYFQVDDIDAAAGRVKAAGGQVVNGPMEVPGGDWIIQAQDPQGAMFALVGQKRS